MVLSVVHGEMIVYGMVCAIWTHTLIFGPALASWLWFGVYYLIQHQHDPAEVFIYFQVTQMISMWVGSLLGWSLVSFLRTPKMFDVDFVCAPYDNVLLFGALLLATGVLFFGNFVGFSSYAVALDDTLGPIVIGGTLILGVILVVTAIVLLLRCDYGKSLLKYLVLLPGYVVAIGRIESSLVNVLVFVPLIFFGMYLYAKYVMRRSDVFFIRPCRTQKLRWFFGWTGFTTYAVAIIGQIAGSCFANDKTQCTEIESIQWTFASVTILALLLFVLYCILAWIRCVPKKCFGGCCTFCKL